MKRNQQPGDWKKWQPGDWKNGSLVIKKNQQPGDIKYGSPVIKIMPPFPHALKALSLSIPSNSPSHSKKKKKTASRFLQNDTPLSENHNLTLQKHGLITPILSENHSLTRSKHGLITPILSENHSLTLQNTDWSLLFTLKIPASPFKTRTDHSYSLWKSSGSLLLSPFLLTESPLLFSP